MLFGVLEQLSIVQNDDQALVLREQPRAAWLLAFGLALTALNLALFGLALTAWGAAGLALLTLLLARGRWLIFDHQAQALQVEWRAWWGVRLAQTLPYDQILRLELRAFPNEQTQIILHSPQGQVGLSVCSRDILPWKEEALRAMRAALGHPNA
ncbi:MAG: hypothetical protein NZ750_09155 [Anaerolineae bacterium]|nr:hypothetical protein [Anaerolineae bacterium]MDW8171786.1 hypothetical protein [Anaerolineae bacterium]